MTLKGPAGLDVIGVEHAGEPVWRRRVPGRGIAAVAAGGVLAIGAGLLVLAVGVGERPVVGGMAGGSGAGVGVGSAEELPTAQVAITGLGGTADHVGEGARGSVRFEVRNGGPQVRVLSLTAELAGVSFAALIPPNGVTLLPDERIELALSFAIADCAATGSQGRLVLRTSLQGREDELVRTVVGDDAGPVAGQVVLRPVFAACSG